MTLLWIGANSKESIVDEGQWQNIKPGIFIRDTLQPVLDHVLAKRTETPDFSEISFPPEWNNEDVLFFTAALWGGFFSLLPTPYLAKTSRNSAARQFFGELENGGLFSWDDLEDSEQVGFLSSMRQDKGGINFSQTKQKKQKVGFLGTLQKVWVGTAWPGGEMVKVTPGIDSKGVFGWLISVSHPVQLPVAEIFFLVNFNIRKLKLCLKCFRFHWDRKHEICKVCREDKTPEETFANTLYQASSRGRVSVEDRKRFLSILNFHGLDEAKKRYKEFLKQTKS